HVAGDAAAEAVVAPGVHVDGRTEVHGDADQLEGPVLDVLVHRGRGRLRRSGGGAGEIAGAGVAAKTQSVVARGGVHLPRLRARVRIVAIPAGDEARAVPRVRGTGVVEVVLPALACVVEPGAESAGRVLPRAGRRCQVDRVEVAAAGAEIRQDPRAVGRAEELG